MGFYYVLVGMFVITPPDLTRARPERVGMQLVGGNAQFSGHLIEVGSDA